MPQTVLCSIGIVAACWGPILEWILRFPTLFDTTHPEIGRSFHRTEFEAKAGAFRWEDAANRIFHTSGAARKSQESTLFGEASIQIGYDGSSGIKETTMACSLPFLVFGVDKHWQRNCLLVLRGIQGQPSRRTRLHPSIRRG